ncbi:MAG: hypothetical protein OXF74_06775 [Rhodobacteraceae bacterium]|nr:hypothetical protein [Paracoccaceae bacterium]
MINRWTNLFLAAATLSMMAAFTLGLAQGISAGFAGFWGGLPFWVIALSVLALAAYDVFDSCVRRPPGSDR